MTTLAYARRRDAEFELELGRAARALEVLGPAAPPVLRESELFGEFQVPAPVRRVRLFTCSPADLTEVGRVVGRPVTRAELLVAVEDAAGLAVQIARQAATALDAPLPPRDRTCRSAPRSATATHLFGEAFGVDPQFVPRWWRPQPCQARWRDLGELVAVRLRRAAGLIDSGAIRYFCWHRPAGPGANCTECSQGPQTIFACSSFLGRSVICFGGAFWRAFQGGDRATLGSTVLHEALHIYFGRNVQDTGRSSNANCYERFALRFSGLGVHPATDRSCPAGISLDSFATGSSALTPAHRQEITEFARVIVGSGPLASRVRLTGHTDNSGPAGFNATLGANRAQAVRQELGATVDRLRAALSPRINWIVESRGENEPIAQNGTAAGRARNRRVHVRSEG